MSARFIGVLPAAGQARRLHPFRYPKELLPIAFAPENNGPGVRPIPVAEYSLRAFSQAGVDQCLIVIADWKTELVRYFGDGNDLGLHIAYLNQNEATGLADAVDLGFEWFRDDNVCLALPDTIFRPINAVASICQALSARGADLVLGVFPTDQPEHLGPVRIGTDGRVIEVQDKPARTDMKNTWGVAAWSRTFTQFLHDALSSRKEERASVGYFFNLAVSRGLNVDAVFFESGRYIDVGMANSIGSLVLSKET